MLYEYGLDPECLNDWNSFRFFMDKFGISHGRLISQFPKSWVKKVHEACHNFSFIQKQKMEIELTRIKKQALIKSGRAFDNSKTWKANAIEQHYIKPFHAVITDENENNTDSDFMLNASQITPDTSLWKVSRERAVPRTAIEMGNAIEPLLKMSNRILFIDKLFEPATKRWQESLFHFIESAIQDRKKYPEFEYHFQINEDNLMIGGSKVNFENYCNKHLGNVIPAGVKLKLVRWSQKESGEGFHARYILTEKGGIRIDWGLDTGKQGQTTDISLLDMDLWGKRWNSFQEDSDVFELVETVTVHE
ncbi:MAG: hypothetical protein GY795_31530 [Desulfobacterales bacterium]|nr:hypothetical protein [Desulfobacterales bacterium]